MGSWHTMDRLHLSREQANTQDSQQEHPMANKSFVITAILVSNEEILHHDIAVQNPPYTMLVESEKKLTGNDRFEGFAVDLAKGK